MILLERNPFYPFAVLVFSHLLSRCTWFPPSPRPLTNTTEHGVSAAGGRKRVCEAKNSNWFESVQHHFPISLPSLLIMIGQSPVLPMIKECSIMVVLIQRKELGYLSKQSRERATKVLADLEQDPFARFSRWSRRALGRRVITRWREDHSRWHLVQWTKTPDPWLRGLGFETLCFCAGSPFFLSNPSLLAPSLHKSHSVILLDLS